MRFKHALSLALALATTAATTTTITSIILTSGAGSLPSCRAGDAGWIRAGINTNAPHWGLKSGLQWAIPPGGFLRNEPRGLIRLAYPTLPDGSVDLINFIAVEPVVGNHKGFSELEPSDLDHKQGKRIWAVPDASKSTSNSGPDRLVSGRLFQDGTNGECLEVLLKVERFLNGAEATLRARQWASRPDELELTVDAAEHSATMEYCILTATMGNRARTRELWLAGGVARSLELFADYRESGFAPHAEFGVNKLFHPTPGSVLVAVTTDEEHPEQQFPFPGSKSWHYGGAAVTQYWRKPEGSLRPDCRALVNGRYVYWMSGTKIPGGIAFENFELRERFHPGQTFVFGITKRTPRELGFTPDAKR